MTGLLYKDMLLILKHCRSYLLLIVVFMACALTGEGNFQNFFLVYPCFIISMLPLTLYTYDEKEQFCKYCDALPIPRSRYISEKYLLVLMAILLMLLLTALCSYGKMEMQGSFTAAKFGTLLLSTVVLSLFAPSVAMPLVFRFGAERGRVIYLVMVGVACAFGMMFSGSELSASVDVAGAGGLGAAAAAAVLYGISWRISIRIYQKKEL